MSDRVSTRNALPAKPFPTLTVALPDWIPQVLGEYAPSFPDHEQRMQLVIRLAEENVRHGGGPFGAAVFECQSGVLLAPGVNTVVGSRWSGAHAEMVALAVAQQMLCTHDLGEKSPPDYELVTSCEPCSMCYGAIPWAGVRRVVCGAREVDAAAAGFDEGPKPADWVAGLTQRGIEVVRDVLREPAADVLRRYASSGGAIYNGRSATD